MNRLLKMVSIAGLFCCAFCGRSEPVSMPAYSVTPEQELMLQIRDAEGELHPLIAAFAVNAHDKDWGLLFQTQGAELEPQPDGKIRIRWKLAGPEAEHATAETILSPGKWKLSAATTVRLAAACPVPAHLRGIFAHAVAWDAPFKAGNAAALFQSDCANVFHSYAGRHSGFYFNSAGDRVYTGEFSLQPYWKTPPPVAKGLDWNLEFPRPFHVFFENEPARGELRFRNNGTEKTSGTLTLRLRDHQREIPFSRTVEVTLEPEEEQLVPLLFPELKLGFFRLECRWESGGTTRDRTIDFCRIFPPGRKFQYGSIFGGHPYVWSSRTDELLDSMYWIGMGHIRAAWSGNCQYDTDTNWPKTAGKFDPDKLDAWRERYRKRDLMILPFAFEVLELPPSVFTMSEATNEPNTRTIGAAWAEEQKITYIRQKQHDPAIKVGAPGTAGVDLAWYEELAENGCWDYLDFVVVHLHCFPFPPELNNSMTDYFWLADRVVLLRSLFDRFGEKPVFDTEQGYLILNDELRPEMYQLAMVSNQDAAAAFMVRAYLQAMAYGLLGKSWFTTSSYGGFGLIEKNQPTAGYAAYAAMTRMLDGAEYVGELTAPDGGNPSPRPGEIRRSWFGAATADLTESQLDSEHGSRVEVVNPEARPLRFVRAFRLPDGAPLLAAWATLTMSSVHPTPVDTPAWEGQKPGLSTAWDGSVLTGRPKPEVVKITVGTPVVTIVDLMGNARQSEAPGGVLTLELTDEVQYILGADREILDRAAENSLRLFVQDFPGTKWVPAVQLLLPPEGKYPPRASVYEQENAAAAWRPGETRQLTVRITDLSEAGSLRGTIRLELPEGWRSESAEQTFSCTKEQEVFGPFAVTAPASATTGELLKLRSIVETEQLGRLADSVMRVKVR